MEICIIPIPTKHTERIYIKYCIIFISCSILYWKKEVFCHGVAHTEYTNERVKKNLYTQLLKDRTFWDFGIFSHEKPFLFSSSSLVHIAQCKKEIDFIFAEGNLSDDF